MENEKFFLCFGFENFSPEDLKKFHTTLVFFGELNDEQVKEVRAICKSFVETDTFFFIASNRFAFDKVQMFGPKKDIPVLTISDKDDHRTESLISDVNYLRSKLKPYYDENKTFPFNPHVTTDLKYFRSRFDKMFLCGKSYRIVDQWSLT